MKYESIRIVFARYSRYYLKLRSQLKKELKDLRRRPRGIFIKKQIRGHFYYYLACRDKDRVVFKYVGKKIPVRLKREVMTNKKKKKLFTKRFYETEDALYALGIGKRACRGNFAVRFEVFKRDNFTCQYCGRNVKNHDIVLTIDHKHPKKRGGTDNISNLITACLQCNIGKQKHLLYNISHNE